MPLQPGPFGQLVKSDVSLETAGYDFTDDALVLDAELNGIASGWDSFMLDLGNFAAEPWDVELALDLDGMLSMLAIDSANLPTANFNGVMDGWFDAQGSLSDAVAFAPVQAWTDPGGAFNPPDTSTPIAAPTLNPNIYAPAPQTVVGGNSAGLIPSVGLFNITRYGAQNFTVGDQFEAIALGTAGQDVSLVATLNGETLPPVDYGPIDSTGQMFIKGTIDPGSVGTWSEIWTIDGVVYANFNFVVSPAAS